MNNNISPLFTARNIQVLQVLTQGELYIAEIADKIKCPPSTAHKAIALFKKYGLIEEHRIKNRVIIKLNFNNILLRNIKRLLNIEKLSKLVGFKNLRKRGVVGIYGSFALGTDDAQSDIDMWLFSKDKISRSEVSGEVRKLEKQLGKIVNLLILGPNKIKKIREQDPEFYARLKLTSISFGGEDFV